MKAIYYNENKEGRVFDVLSKRDNGTLDIGSRESKTIVVGGVEVVTEPKIGCVTLMEDAPPSEASETSPLDKAKAELLGKTKAELLADVSELNGTLPVDKIINLAPNANKGEIVDALLKAKGLEPAA